MKYSAIDGFVGTWGKSDSYLVLLPDAYERKTILDELFSFLAKKRADFTLHKISSDDEGGFALLMEELQGYSLFGKGKVVLFDGVDKVKKEQMEALQTYLQNPMPNCWLLLGGGSFKGEEAGLSILDLSKEKPWEKRARREKRLQKLALLHKKRLPATVSNFLFDQTGGEIAALEQELRKLITFTGTREQITLEDAKALAGPKASEALWSLAEKIVWEKSLLGVGAVEDVSDLLAFVGSVRHFIQIGAQMEWALAHGEEPAQYIVKAHPKALQRYLEEMDNRPAGYFSHALRALFHLEFQAKSCSVDPTILWDRFCYAISPAKSLA